MIFEFEFISVGFYFLLVHILWSIVIKVIHNGNFDGNILAGTIFQFQSFCFWSASTFFLGLLLVCFWSASVLLPLHLLDWFWLSDIYWYSFQKPSLLPLCFKSSFIPFEVNMEGLAFEFKLPSFCFPTNSLSMSIFQCKYCVILFSNWFWIFFEQKDKFMIFFTLQTTIRQFFYPNLKLFLQRMMLL